MHIVRCLLLVLFASAGLSFWEADETKADGGGWKLKPPAPDAVPVAAQRRLPGIYPAGSRVPDRDAPGGFGPCDNYPMNLGEKGWGTKGTIAVVAFPDEPIAYFKSRGIPVRLINRTGEVVSFSASDSCLFLVQEALDSDGVWREIESPPEPICGNSFHRVYLKPGQYWQFPARVYSGPIKTKIRFRLSQRGLRDRAKPIYSNEFEGQVAAVQFRRGLERGPEGAGAEGPGGVSGAGGASGATGRLRRGSPA